MAADGAEPGTLNPGWNSDKARRIGDAIATMELDRFTAEVVGELERNQVSPILLKGPSFAAWLYEERSARRYGDADLLVGPEQWDDAVAVLERLGFIEDRSAEASVERGSGSVAYSRHDHWSVDLHRVIWGLQISERDQWEQLSAHTETMRLAGRQVRILDVASRSLHVALHAVQHGRSEPKPIVDLERALAVVDDDGWTAVVERARDLGATAALAAGLRLVPAGALLADRLGLDEEPPAEIRLRVDGGGGVRAMSVAKIAQAPTLRLKLQYLWRWVFPSRAKMRRLSVREPPRRWQLTRAYVRHLGRWPHAIHAVRVWRQARPRSRSEAIVEPAEHHDERR